MIVLGADTSTDSLSVSLVDEKKVLATYDSTGTLRHSSLLVPNIKKALKKTRKKVGDIDLYCVGLGPGSFTGLRVGLTSMRGLAVARNKPIVGVPTLDAIAINGFKYLKREGKLHPKIRICPILDAKKQQIYACIYTHDSAKIIRESDYLLEPVENLVKRLKGDVLFLGDAISVYKEQLTGRKSLKPHFLDGKRWLPKASTIARLGLELYKGGHSDDPYELVPMYLYARDCNVRYK